MIRNYCNSIFSLKYQHFDLRRLAKRTYVVARAQGLAGSGALTTARLHVGPTGINGVGSGGAIDHAILRKPAPLSKIELNRLISARQKIWNRNGTVKHVADSALLDVSKIETIVSSYPAVFLLSDEHFLEITVNSLKRPEDELAVTPWRWEKLEQNLQLVGSYGVEIHRLRLANWIWKQEFSTLEERLGINTIPEMKAFLCTQDEGFFRNITMRYTDDELTAKFRDFVKVLHELVDWTDTYELLHYFQRKATMCALPIERVRDVICLLLDAGVSKVDICNDLWIVQHNMNVMKQRVEYARKLGVPITRPWMLRCAEYVFAQYLRHQLTEIQHLKPYDTKEDFLQWKLSCTNEDIQQMKKRCPKIISVNAKKLSDSIGYLLAQGYQSVEIQVCPRVLLLSLSQRVKFRIEAFKRVSYGTRMPRLNQLLGTDEDFNKILNRLEKKIRSK